MKFFNEPIIYMARKTWQYSKGNRHKVLLYLFFFTMANLIYLAWPLIIAGILNMVQSEGLSFDNLPRVIFYLSLFFIIGIGFWAFHGPARVLESTNAFMARAKYKKYLLDGVMDLPASWHTDHHSGDTIDRIEKSTTALFDFSRNSYEVIESIVRLIGAYFALLYFNVHASYIVLIVTVISLTLIFSFDKFLMKQYSELYREENKIAAKVYDTISNISTVIILRVEKLLSKAIWKQMLHPFSLYYKNRKTNEVKWFFVSMTSSTLLFFVIGSYIYSQLISGGVILVGTIFALYEYGDKINRVFFRFAYKYGGIVQQKTAVLNGEEVADQFKKIFSVKKVNLAKGWEELSIEGLSFSYSGSHRKDLNNVDLQFFRGERIALVGESGSGKSTLMKLIRNLYPLSKGNLYVDNVEVSNGFSAISSYVSLVPQDPEIFASTIGENITLGVPHTQAFVERFTDMAEFTKVAKSLPHGFKSSIVEKGVNLSGGQKQRLALARGLLASVDKEIILLDESTSSVDTVTERKIYRNIFKAFKEKTIIVSVHRLHLLPQFDTIYFFSKGKLIASGSHRELLRKNSDFKKLWKKYKDIK